MNEIQLATLLVAILGPVSLWFGLGARIGRLEQKIDGNRELVDGEIGAVERNLLDCQGRAATLHQDVETRLRGLERQESVPPSRGG